MSSLTPDQEMEQFKNVATLVADMSNLKEQGCPAGYNMHQTAKKEAKDATDKLEKRVDSNSKLVTIVGTVGTVLGVVIGYIIRML